MLLIGRKHKNAALQQLCKARYHSTSEHRPEISLRADNSSLSSKYPQLFADCNLSRRDILPSFDDPKLCHCHEMIPSLPERWAAIGSASSLPRSIRPRVIIVTRGGAVMGNILEENQFIDNLFRPDSTSRLLSSFADVRLSHLQPAELSPEAQYLDLQGDMMEELHAARRNMAGNALITFNFIQSSQRMHLLNRSFSSHVSMFLAQAVCMRAPYKATALYVASAILIDAYPPKTHIYEDCSFAKLQCQEIEDFLKVFFNTMINNNEFFSECHQHPLPCSHFIYDYCIQKYSEQFEGSEDEFMIKKCLPCKELTCLKVRVKPSTAGVRIISIDEEGIHVIMPLNVLEMMQAYIPHLPLHYLVDFWGGTSTEGNVALNMRVCQHDVKDTKSACLKQMKLFFEKNQKVGITKPHRLVKALWADGVYKSKNIDSVYIHHFRPTLRMRNTPRSNISAWKVAIITSTIGDRAPVLIMNYNRYQYAQTKSDDDPLVWQVRRVTTAVPDLFPSVNIPRVGSLQNGGTHPHNNNNPVHMALSEAQHLWPTTKPDVVISLGTGSQSLVQSSKTSSFQNFMRINFPFSGAPPAMNDADATESMSQWVRKQPRKRIEEALILLLVSCFYFILDAVPDFHSGLFYCVGSLQCRAPPRPIIQALLSLRPTTLCFYKDSLNLGFCLAEEDICESCQRYCRPVRFCVRDLKETVTLALCRDDAIHEVSMFPNTIQWFIDQQDLESNFGLENHGISFHIQCTAAFYRPAILMLMILKTMNEPTGTIATMHDKAQHGNLANVTDFVVNFLHENLRRIAPSAGIQQEVKTAFQPPRTSQALFITLGGSIVVFGRVSATQDINELRNTLVEEVTQKAVAQGGRRKGFAFATSRGGGLKCQFFEVRGAADFDPIPNEPLDFDADEARIVAILEHCLEYFNV
ncbi:hypothetical protein BDDG_06996 [Blastomyces dermatitidis ATCC 18188]|uniref:PNPLA domain-containing protein n=1 Tax=Ajellomyces dermatitidis (strain ATCC 18188 / CBS 674.68) TaxID=653446 RepID=F2TLD8_AJEDA|nr:hypothetical protein BDDG_06996 [Blastomyces dermatitidis ATCC 18188]